MVTHLGGGRVGAFSLFEVFFLSLRGVCLFVCVVLPFILQGYVCSLHQSLHVSASVRFCFPGHTREGSQANQRRFFVLFVCFVCLALRIFLLCTAIGALLHFFATRVRRRKSSAVDCRQQQYLRVLWHIYDELSCYIYVVSVI